MTIARISFYLLHADARDDADANSIARFVYDSLIKLFNNPPPDLALEPFGRDGFYLAATSLGGGIAQEFDDLIFVIAEKNNKAGRGAFNRFKQPFGKIKYYHQIRCLPPGFIMPDTVPSLNKLPAVAQHLDDFALRDGFVHEFIHYLDTLRHSTGLVKTRYDVRDLKNDSGDPFETDPEILKKRERFKQQYYSDPFEYNAIYHEGITEVINLWRKLETDPINATLYLKALRRKVPKRAQDFISLMLEDNDRFQEMPPLYKRKFLRRLANLHQMIVPYIY